MNITIQCFKVENDINGNPVLLQDDMQLGYRFLANILNTKEGVEVK